MFNFAAIFAVLSHQQHFNVDNMVLKKKKAENGKKVMCIKPSLCVCTSCESPASFISACFCV